MTVLNRSTLWSLGIPGPRYDRSAIRPGIVHIGVGSFHRAHQAMYLDALMAAGAGADWGIVGVGVGEGDRPMKDALDAQDGLYTLVLKHPDGRLEPRVIGSILKLLLAPDDPEAVIEQLADPAIRIVSLTLTEGGYNFHAVTGSFDPSTPAVAADLRAGDGVLPLTTFGLVTEALRRRRARGVPPFTVLSCDNVQGNGEVARRSFGTFARLRDPELGDWVERDVRFPSCLVDRITPVTTDADRAELADRFGVEDACPVVCEPFTQWVVEDFPDRPPLERVGVRFVADVEPYELMKLRLLNAAHQGLAYFGHLAGYRLVHEAAEDRLFQRFLLRYMDSEATPSLHPVPGVDLTAYKLTLIERFRNPQVRDTIARLCAESSDRIPRWVLPVIRYNLEHGGEIRRAAAIVASWARYAEGVDEQGGKIDVVDRHADDLVPVARRQAEEPLAFVSRRDLFGDLVESERFRRAYLSALASLHEKGARRTLESLV